MFILVLPLTILIVALIYWFYPPKKINYIYGYRTGRSMKSQEAWDFANHYASKLLIWVAVINFIFTGAALGLLENEPAINLTSSFSLFPLLFFLIYLVEKRLKEKGF